MDDAKPDTVMRGSKNPSIAACGWSAYHRPSCKRFVRVTRICTSNHINAKVERLQLLLELMFICMRFVRGASVSERHPMSLLESTSPRPSSVKITIVVSSNRFKLEVGKFLSSARAA
jgi:hypothetical protein